MAEQQKRPVAYKLQIKDILNSRYMKEEGWNLNYFLLNNVKVSRVNVTGIVLSKFAEESAGYSSIVIDDGTGNIQIRFFESSSALKDLCIGDAVLVIGRPKEYGAEKYLVPEIIKKIENKAWLKYRKAELEMPLVGKEIHKEQEVCEEKYNQPSQSDMIVDFIKKNDKGNGADYKDLLKIKDAEKTIELLLKDGNIFEVKPGKFKVLE